MQNVEKFKTWLTKRGAIVLPETNPWEVIRFKAAGGVSVVYTNKNGHLSFTGESQKAYDAFSQGKQWKSIDRRRKNLSDKKARLATRDGKRCFADLKPMGFDQLTIEHLLSFAHGGTDNENNLVLMCDEHNKLMANLPLSKKIDLIVKLRTGPIFTIDKTDSTPEHNGLVRRIFKGKI